MWAFTMFQSLLMLLCGVYFVYQLRHRRMQKLIGQFPGPSTYPVIGNIQLVMGPRPRVLDRMQKALNQYTSPTRFWLFSKPALLVCDPDSFQIVLNKLATKGWIFAFFKDIWGEGLATLEDYDAWKLHKRFINPAINNLTTMGEKYLEVYHHTERRLIKDLDVFADTEQQFDALQFIYDREAEKIFHAITGFDSEYVEEKHMFQFKKLMGTLRGAAMRILQRVCQPLLYPEVINRIYVKLTGGTSELEHAREILQKVVRDRHELIKKDQVNNQDSELENHNIILDILLNPNIPAKYNNSARVDEIITFLEAGSLPVSLTVCWSLLMLAMHPEYQDQVYNEIKEVFGDTENVTKTREFDKLVILERCIKETMRLFPPTPFILRHNNEDLVLKDGRVVPPGTLIISSVLFLHRNESLYSNPEVWNPDRFLPEEVMKRHSHSFLPFSVGPHTCPGAKYAYLTIKSELAALLQKYQFTTDLKMSDVKLTFDPVLRNITGYRFRIRRRQ